jgi:hypothetical protein
MRRSDPDRPAYEHDFHAWALDQAARLRAYAQGRSNEPIDWELLAEEVEDMGNSARFGCESLVEQIIAHLLKIEYAAATASLRHWAVEIDGFRISLERRLTPSIERALRDSFPARWRNGRRLALNALALDEPTVGDRLPTDCPYGWEQISGTWLPPRVLALPRASGRRSRRRQG